MKDKVGVVPLEPIWAQAGSRSSASTAGPERLTAVERLAGRLSASWNRSGCIIDSRRWQRVPFHRPIELTPLDEAGEPAGPAFVVKGRDVSPGGVSFFHSAPLPWRDVVATFTLDDGRVVSVVTRLRWCRFSSTAQYQSGGRFLRTIELN